MLPPAWTLWLLGTFNVLYDWSSFLGAKSSQLWTAVSSVFRPQYYYVFDDRSAFYPLKRGQAWATGAQVPSWIYCADTRTFCQWRGTLALTLQMFEVPMYPGRPLQDVLSLELVDGETVHYDLTDFLEGVRIIKASTSDEDPLVAHLVEAWSVSSAIIPDTKRFRARLMNTMAQTTTTTIRFLGPAAEVFAEEEEEEAPAPAPAAQPVPMTTAPPRPVEMDLSDSEGEYQNLRNRIATPATIPRAS